MSLGLSLFLFYISFLVFSAKTISASLLFLFYCRNFHTATSIFLCNSTDGKQDGEIYNNFFKPLYQAYENKISFTKERGAKVQQNLVEIMGDGDINNKSLIKERQKYLNTKSMFKNNTIADGERTIELSGWEQIGVYVYAKNIYGFIKLVSSSGNNIALEEIAKINPEYTKMFIELALDTRDKNYNIANKKKYLASGHTLEEYKKLFREKDILNHISTDELYDVLYSLENDEEYRESSLPKYARDIGDMYIKAVSERSSEFVEAGYNEWNVLTQLQDNYFPLVADSKQSLISENRKKQATIDKGRTINRQLTDKYSLKLDLRSSVYSVIENQENVINMARAVSDARWLLSDKGGNLKSLISNKFGREWGKYFDEYLSMMAENERDNLSSMEETLNRLIGNIAVSRIGLNVMTSVKQLISLVPAMTVGELNAMETLKGFMAVTDSTKGKEILQFIKENAPSVYYSSMSIEISRARDVQAKNGVDELTSNIREKTMWLTEKIDGLVKQAIWYAKYQKEMAKGVKQSDAIFKATQLVQTTQSISDTPSLAKMQRNKNPLYRVAYMFTNDLFQIWNILTGDVKNAWNQGNKKKAFLEVAGVLLNGAILSFVSGGWLKDDNDKDEWWEGFLQNWASELSGFVPMAGPFLQDVVTGFSTPFYRGVEEVNNAFVMAQKQLKYWASDGKKGKDYEVGDWVDKGLDVITEGVLTLTGSPATMAQRAIRAIFPSGISKGTTKDANSLWYLIGSKYGNAMYNED